VPLHLVALPFHEPIEDIESLRGAIDLDKLRGIYTLEEFQVSKEDPAASGQIGPKELHEAKLRELHSIRRRHQENVFKVLDRFKDIIRESINEAADGSKSVWDDQLHPYVLMTYNELIR
jgi:hypothetical protein